MNGTEEECPDSAESFAVPARTTTSRFFLWGILMLLTVPLFGLVVHLPHVTHLDRSILDALVAVRTPALTQVMLVVTKVFAPLLAVPWTIVLGCVIRMLSGSWREGFVIPAAMVSSSAITALIKEFIERIRPTFPERLVVEGSYSFPSGHTTAVAAACVAGVLLILRHLGNRLPNDEGGPIPRLKGRVITGFVIAGAIALIVLIAFTRLYLGAHWFSDVVAGALVGTAASLIVAELLVGNT